MPNLTVLPSRCTAARRNGAFCDRESLPDAPFPICVRHAADVLRYLNSFMSEEGGEALSAARDLEEEPRQQVAVPTEEVVYYFRIGGHIKIGYSANLTQRMRFYPPDAVLLATEPGDRALERKRLRQFRRGLRSGREWFAPSDELMRHIESLQVPSAA